MNKIDSAEQPENKNRINRGTYLLSYVVLNVVYWLLLFGTGLFIAFVTGIRTEDGVRSIYKVLYWLSWIPYAAYLIPLVHKRLHDLSQSGWLALFILVPILNILFNLYLMIAPGNPKSNAYGIPPRKTYLAGLYYK